MDSFLIPGLIAVTTMSLIVAVLYLYLYLNNKDRILQFWSAAWGIYSLRFVIQTSVVLHFLPPWMVVLQEVATLTGTFLCIAGAKAFANKPADTWWWYGAVISIGWVVFAQIVHLPFLAADLPIAFFTGLLFCWSGIIILHQTQIRSPGRIVSGYALILWGIHRADYTFLRPVGWFAPWGFLIAAVLFLTAAIGILLLYYDKIRGELEREIQERKEAESAFQENEKDLKASQRIAHLGSWRLDLDTNKVRWTEELYRMYGFDLALTPPPYSEYMKLFTPESWKQLSTALSKTIETGIPYELELETVWGDGSNGWMWMRGETEKDSAGKIIGLWGAAQDISQRKRAEDALLESEKRLSFVLNGSQLGFWDWDILTGKVTRNDIWAEMLGYTLEEIEFSTKQWTDLHHPDDKDLAWQSIQDHLEGRTSVHRIEYRMRTKNGQYKWILDQAKIVQRDSNGNPLRMSGTHTDITDLKNAEEKLKENEQRYVRAQRMGKVGNWEYDLVNGTFWGSEMAKQIYGFDSESDRFTTDEIENCIPERERVHQALIDLIEKDVPYNLEFDIHPASGLKARTIRSMAEVLRDESGAPLKVVGVIQDITEQIESLKQKEKLEKELIQAQKMESIGTLAGGIAHDFNNMLSIILGNSEIMMEDIEPGHPCSSNLKEIRNAAQRSADLTRQLLAFARKQTISPKILNPNHVIEGMLKMLKRLIGEDIDLLWRPQTDLWSIKIDPSQIDQILANLCVNARDAIKGVGKVTIETGNISFDETYCEKHTGFISGNYIVIGVSDNGCGMDRETKTHLFEPFFTTKKNGEGTGLGLATVYGIVKQNSGFINVYSEIDQGTTFKIYLPRYFENSEQKTENEVQKDSPKGHETILLVEDEDAILKMTRQILERLGYTVLAANTPDEAIKISNVSGIKIDLMITDVVMPSMNGRELAEEILLSFPNMKCLYMSGYPANVIAHRGILDDGLDFINKPFSKQDLSIKLRKILD
ncbi:PAS domain-containing protein [uncultured Desulfobacter sp.]|uniref:PAS domain-containing protein n=1 Tax=uncultured Desulfobacter sp. TaxID=240139 RepID=UPI002AAB929D|nr:PAS domain-containing protein [uncultured Desulfobacter sp.]